MKGRAPRRDNSQRTVWNPFVCHGSVVRRGVGRRKDQRRETRGIGKEEQALVRENRNREEQVSISEEQNEEEQVSIREKRN